MNSNKNVEELTVIQETGENNSRSNYNWIITLIIILGLTLPFHYVPSELKMFPKDNLSFSNTIITQKDVDNLLERYNSCESIFQQQIIAEEPLFKKLNERGLIYTKK